MVFDYMEHPPKVMTKNDAYEVDWDFELDGGRWHVIIVERHRQRDEKEMCAPARVKVPPPGYEGMSYFSKSPGAYLGVNAWRSNGEIARRVEFLN